MSDKRFVARIASKGLTSAFCLALATGCVCLAGASGATASCMLTTPTTWSGLGNGDWSTGSDWSGGVVPNSSSTNVCITNGASTVTLDVNAAVGDLQIGVGNTLTTNVGTNFSVSGPQLVNGGGIAINGGGGGFTFFQVGDVTLSGGGVVTLNVSSGVGDSFIRGSGATLTNVDNTIEGAGSIGDVGALTLVNKATIDANAPGQRLILNIGNGGVTNTGLLEATNGGTLVLTFGNTNTGGQITADGGTVFVGGGATILGGTLNTTGGGSMHNFGSGSKLDGVTISAGSTYTAAANTSSALANTITNKGTFQIDGPNTVVNLANNVTLQGGGVVNFVPGNGALRGSGVTLTNLDNTIEGAGFIGDIGALTLVNKATINANGSVLHEALVLNEGDGGVTNTGLLEATNVGQLILHNTIANVGANITASGGVVFIAGTIQGGTLNTSGGGTMVSDAGLGVAPKLDDVTISPGSTYTAGLAGAAGPQSTFTELVNTITNKGTFLINGGGGSDTIVNLGTNVGLQGGGVVTLSDVGGGSFLRGDGVTLANVDNTIQGAGNIGDVGRLGLVNGAAGTIYANVSGETLSVGAAGGSLLNNGAVKVAGGATLLVIGDASGYVQNQAGSAAPITQIDGTFTALNGVAILAGVLEGTGTIAGNVVSSGTVHPGDSPGVLKFTGTYAQLSSGIFDVTLAGLTPGTGFSQLQVGGSAALAGALDVFTANGFILAVNDTFEIMDFANSTGDFSTFDFNGQSCSLAAIDLWSCVGGFQFEEQFASGHALDLVVKDVGVTTGVPEPSTWVMMLLGLSVIGFAGYRQRDQSPTSSSASVPSAARRASRVVERAAGQPKSLAESHGFRRSLAAAFEVLPDLEQPRPPDAPPGLVKLRLTKRNSARFARTGSYGYGTQRARH
jgi:PEP-CTERM motif